MTYIVNGQVVESQPWSIKRVFHGIWSIVVLFFATLTSREPTASHVDQYRRGEQSSKRRPLGGLAKPASTGCAGSGG